MKDKPIYVLDCFRLTRITKSFEDSYDLHVWQIGEWQFKDNAGQSTVDDLKANSDLILVAQ